MAKIRVEHLPTGKLGWADADEVARRKDIFRVVSAEEQHQAQVLPDQEEQLRQSLTPVAAQRLSMDRLRQVQAFPDAQSNLGAALDAKATGAAFSYPADVRSDVQSNLENVVNHLPAPMYRLPGGQALGREIPVFGSSNPARALMNVLGNLTSFPSAVVQAGNQAVERAQTGTVPPRGRFREGGGDPQLAYDTLRNTVRNVLWPSERKSLGENIAQTVRTAGTPTPTPKEPTWLDRLTTLRQGDPYQPGVPISGQPPPTPEAIDAARERAVRESRPAAGTMEQRLGPFTPRSAEVAGDVATLFLPVGPVGMGIKAGFKGARAVAKPVGRAWFNALTPTKQAQLTDLGDFFRKGGALARMPVGAEEAKNRLIRGEVASDQGRGQIADELDKAFTDLQRTLGREPTRQELGDALDLYETLPSAAAGVNHPNPITRALSVWEERQRPRRVAASQKVLEGDRPYARHEWTPEKVAEEKLKAQGLDPAMLQAESPTSGAAGLPLTAPRQKARYLTDKINAIRQDRGLEPIPDTVRAKNQALKEMFGLTEDVFSTDPRVQAAYRMRQVGQLESADLMRDFANMGQQLARLPRSGNLTPAQRVGLFDPPQVPLQPKFGDPLHIPGYRVPNRSLVPAWHENVPDAARMVVPEEMAQWLERTASRGRAKKGEDLTSSLIEQATGSARGGLLHEWTGLATVARPGYHFRNRLNNVTSGYEEIGPKAVPFSPAWMASRSRAEEVLKGTAQNNLDADFAVAHGLWSSPGKITPTEMSWQGSIPSLRVKKMGPFRGGPLPVAGKVEDLYWMEKYGPSQWAVPKTLGDIPLVGKHLPASVQNAKIPGGGFNPMQHAGEVARSAEEMDRAHLWVMAREAGMSKEEALAAVQKTLYSRYNYPEGIKELRQFFPFGGWQFANLQGKLQRLEEPGAGRMFKAGQGLERISEDVALDDERRRQVRTMPQGPYAASQPKIFLGQTKDTQKPIYINNPGTAYGEITDLLGMATPVASYLTDQTRRQPLQGVTDPAVASFDQAWRGVLSRANPIVSQGLALANIDAKRGRQVFPENRDPEGFRTGARASYEKAGRGSAVAHKWMEQLGLLKPPLPGQDTPTSFLGTVRPQPGAEVQQSLMAKRLLDVWPSPFGSATDVVNEDSEVPRWAALAAFLAGGTAGTIDFARVQEALNAADRENLRQTAGQKAKTGPIPGPLLRR